MGMGDAKMEAGAKRDEDEDEDEDDDDEDGKGKDVNEDAAPAPAPTPEPAPAPVGCDICAADDYEVEVEGSEVFVGIELVTDGVRANDSSFNRMWVGNSIMYMVCWG